MNAVKSVPAINIIIKQMFDQNSLTNGMSQPYIIVKAIPKTWAPAFIRPDDVPSGSGYVNSDANSKPTGR